MNTISKYIIGVSMCLSVILTQSFASEDKGSAVNIPFDFPDVIVLKPKEITTVNMIRSIQEEYIRKKYDGYQIQFTMYTKDSKNSPIEIFMLKNDEGKMAQMAFDMTQVYGKLKSKNKKTKEKIEELEKKH